MEYTAEIYNLSQQFYEDYPNSLYPEILLKNNRPYSCLLIEYMSNLFICIPFRSNINHKNAYHFKNSIRSQKKKSGLDYTKIVLIKNTAYLDNNVAAIVDQDEYKETMQHLTQIVEEVYKYISEYKDDLNDVKKIHPKEWKRKYGKSTLPYYDEFLKGNNKV